MAIIAGELQSHCVDSNKSLRTSEGIGIANEIKDLRQNANALGEDLVVRSTIAEVTCMELIYLRDRERQDSPGSCYLVTILDEEF